MKKTIKVLVMLFLMIFFSNFHSFALDIKTLNNEINIDILKDKNDILVLKSEIINENYEDETYIRNYKNILIKYTDNKEVFKINLSNKSVKKNKKSIYQMPKSLVYIDNKEYYVVENTDNNFFSVTKISSNGKKLSQKSFSGTVTNIKKINENELILIGGSPAFIIKINKDDLKEEQKVLEDNSSIFNDFIVTKDYFLMVGEDYITKESLMIKYDKTLKKLISMSLGCKEFTKIIENKDKSYFLLGENNLGGILTKYSNKEKIIFQKEQEKNIAAKVIYVYEELDQTIIFNYLLEKKEIEISKYKDNKLIDKKIISSLIEPFVLRENNEFYIATNNKLYKINKNLKTSYLNTKNINKIIKVISDTSNISIISEKSIDNYNKLFIHENLLKYLFIIVIILIIIFTCYYIKITDIKNKKAYKKVNKIHTKLHNQTKSKTKKKKNKKVKKYKKK